MTPVAVRQALVVGSSRSGTTMMGRILGRHPDVVTFEELHFFEQQWQPEVPAPAISRKDADAHAARLLAIQREGYHRHRGGAGFEEEAGRLVDGVVADIDAEAGEATLTAPRIYEAFGAAEAAAGGGRIACDQTPRNLYYLDELSALLPDAVAVVMVRDPRDVLLSQKNRWRRRSLADAGTTRRNALRTWSGYNALTISLLWRSAAAVADRHSADHRVVLVRFEDLLEDPEREVRRVCRLVGIDYRPDLLEVPRVGSSHRRDRPDEKGIDPSAAGGWRAGLTSTEVWVTQRVTADAMKRLGYEPAPVRPGVFGLARMGVALVTKSVLALALNAGRARNLIVAARRRLAS